ncbi:MAG: hypothetical protein JXR97_16570 [Planctomycetes bacterium]|nr:hypothetical protein [Planctomycetota bacterium]
MGILIRGFLADDDSCQQMLYAKGHHDKIDFLSACREEADFALINDDDEIRHVYMRWCPVRNSIVGDLAAYFQDKPGRGAFKVTVLNVWLPLWDTQEYHERFKSSATNGTE